MMAQNAIQSYKCEICNQIWLSYNAYLFHVKEHNAMKPVEIVEPGSPPLHSALEELKSMVEDVSKPLEKAKKPKIRYPTGSCVFCGKIMLERNIQRHIKLAHPDTMPFYCLSCNRKCFGEPKLSLAQGCKAMSYSCNFCQKNHVTYLIDELKNSTKPSEEKPGSKEILFRPYNL